MSMMNAENQKRKILIIDDEPDILELLSYNLQTQGYTIKTALDGKEGFKIAKSFLPNLILLDIMMPKIDGVEMCRQIRQQPQLHDTYILFLTARSEEYSEIAAFDAGADDYLTKPIRPRALMSRISAIFQRSLQKDTSDNKDVIKIADFVINKSSYTLKEGNNFINLPKKEFELLFFLAQSPNKVFSRDEILKNIWGADVFVLARTVDVHIRRIREKIGEKYIKTVKGVGYKFVI